VLNQTADRIVIHEDSARMTIIYENLTNILNNGSSGDVHITAPHNFMAAANGNGFRDGTIYEPDGTELFAK
jgi:hypothetical protein